MEHNVMFMAKKSDGQFKDIWAFYQWTIVAL